jgi:hypothetical protein
MLYRKIKTKRKKKKKKNDALSRLIYDFLLFESFDQKMKVAEIYSSQKEDATSFSRVLLFLNNNLIS